MEIILYLIIDSFELIPCWFVANVISRTAPLTMHRKHVNNNFIQMEKR